MASHPPSPAPTPQPSERASISAEINIATRKQHTELNRLIIERLPLALPPHSSNPALLGQGLAAFAKIFFVFEAVWASLDDGKTAQDGGKAGDTRKTELLSRLKCLRPEVMERSQRLATDLRHIERITGQDWSHHTSAELPVGQGLIAKPHLLLAYAWVMYMAIFSGGRWIRQQLQSAGPVFWAAPVGITVDDSKKSAGVMPGFSFLCFEGEQDGEDIKRDFKPRLAETEALLNYEERQEVIHEARRLFEHCVALVHQLDDLVLKQRLVRVAGVAALLGLLLVALVWLYWYDQYGYLST
ncbi:hypothetical protein LTR78_000505 [Recurvomyces mirabilis]|uniref:Uncharacterized protein n=1 Tax=Recurvomyces mirabilis TaxID=574656 RepID=A0AAE0WY21_9PEZI|nr:hypothetical protein LTR78_000505 [Recurvomyces mirabilis]KAK5162160.1 hypothetical protein LTS14_000506 [Recurvomyces mirabilis]